MIIVKGSDLDDLARSLRALRASAVPGLVVKLHETMFGSDEPTPPRPFFRS
ncbi:hypothetical protein [Streptomyces hoynatensis]|uniref:hypothetical protein n=1 Tax=Streptomyces hoynatensis TaxID=1141874 RepID=UPI001319C3AB|nr:hypothetical protein [Streptomyces hoynatensis]